MKDLNIINKAIRVATMAHAGQARKGSDIPYITHPYAVAVLAQHYVDDEEIVAACLLHDVLEDISPTIYNEKRMLADFGEKITNLVKAVSEPKIAGEPEKPWKERKDAYFERLENSNDKRAIIVSCADKICNLNDILNDYDEIGEELWQRFKADKFEQLWFYKKCLKEAQGNVPEEMSGFYEQLVERLSNIVSEQHHHYGDSPYDEKTTEYLKKIGVDIFETEVPAE